MNLWRPVKLYEGEVDIDLTLEERLIAAQKEYMADSKAADAQMTTLDKLGDSVDVEHLDRIEQKNTQELQDAGALAIRSGRTSTTVTLIVAALALLIGVLIGIVITRMIVASVGGEPAEIEELARKVADGDLSVRLDTRNGRATGIFRSISEMVVKLTEELFMPGAA